MSVQAGCAPFVVTGTITRSIAAKPLLTLPLELGRVVVVVRASKWEPLRRSRKEEKGAARKIAEG